MKRSCVTFLVLAALAAGLPARADTLVVDGFVRSPAVTPTVPRTLHLITDRANGTVGWVAPLSNAASARSYQATVVSAAPGATDVDVWFYRDLEGPTGTGDPCPREARDRFDGSEDGTLCVGARYAVVVLFAGADVRFRLTVS